jgi:hypothetical protein
MDQVEGISVFQLLNAESRSREFGNRRTNQTKLPIKLKDSV